MEQFFAGELSVVDSVPQASREEFRERAALVSSKCLKLRQQQCVSFLST